MLIVIFSLFQLINNKPKSVFYSVTIILLIIVLSFFLKNDNSGKFSVNENNVSAKKLQYDKNVYLVQSYLKELGYIVGNSDGVLGEQTKNAIIRFRTNNNLSSEAIIDEELFLEIEKHRINRANIKSINNKINIKN